MEKERDQFLNVDCRISSILERLLGWKGLVSLKKLRRLWGSWLVGLVHMCKALISLLTVVRFDLDVSDN
jgi:hypothetical protein